MRCLARNKSNFYYALYNGKSELYTDDGLSTGEFESNYDDPVQAYGNISPATGATATELFGTLEGYDKIIVVDDPNTPIDEYTVLWIDTTSIDESYDYTVKRVARSLNSASIAISRVEVS